MLQLTDHVLFKIKFMVSSILYFRAQLGCASFINATFQLPHAAYSELPLENIYNYRA